jgi:hypothetical protein
MATIGVAAESTFEMIGRREDEVRPFVIKVLRGERSHIKVSLWRIVNGLGSVCHY